MSDHENPLSADNLFTAARRVARFIRIDDQKDGGLLSQQTLAANEHLERILETEERRIKQALAEKGAA